MLYTDNNLQKNLINILILDVEKNNFLIGAVLGISVFALIIIIFLVQRYKRAIKENEVIKKNLKDSYRELEEAHNELLASEEELHKQIDKLDNKKEELRISRERYRLASNGAEVGIWEWDFSEGTVYFSSKAKELTGIKEKGKINPKILLGRVLVQDRKIITENYLDHINRKTDVFECQFRIETKDNKFSWIKVRGKALFNINGEPIRMAGSLNNINKEKLSEAKIHKLAYYDELTGLPNRVYFMNSLKKALKYNKIESMIAILIIDLDNFKGINDALGHSYGDKVLKNIALRLQHVVGINSLLARFGGDEFILYRSDCFTRFEIHQYAKEVLNVFEESICIGEINFTITASIGIAVIPEDDVVPENIIKYAEMALYDAKNNGKNNYEFYTSKLSKQVIRRIQIENDLRQAVKNNQLKLVYQPKLDLSNNKVTGVEALIRWHHPTKGIISPAEFIPIAEENGSIIEVGDWVIREAIRQLKEWHNEDNTNLTMSINLSAKQFKDLNLKNTFSKTLQESNVHPMFLEIEITETAALADIEYANMILNDLKSTGMKVSLDDFGTGYSSLSYLKKLPINNLKIDKSFIDDILEENKGEQIIRSIISLSHAYEIKVIAEGVETNNQLEFLKNENCDIVQGYYISKPLPSDELRKFIKEMI
ncbi:MAG: EAL domain-containing protein [Eubacteriales bacterium]